MAQNKISLNKINITFIIVALLLCIFTSCGKIEREIKIPTEEEVILSLQNKTAEFENAFSDLKPAGTFKSENYCYSRFQQTYMGAPVFGRSVIYISDKEGKEYLVCHNLEDVPENINTEFGVSSEGVKKKIEAFLKAEYPDVEWENLHDFSLNPSDICVYNLEGPARFAYNVNLYGFNMVIDANNGDILYAKPLLVSEKASFKDSGSVFEVLKTQRGEYVLKDENTGVYIYTVQGATYFDGKNNEVNSSLPILIESEDNIFGNEDDNMTKERTNRAEEILKNINAVDNYFTELAGEKLIENTVVIFDDALSDKSGHGSGGGYGYIGNWVDVSLVPDYKDKTYMTSACIYLGESYSKNPSMHIGTYAHEYTHALTEKIIAWSGSPNCAIDENGAIDEAISDIFGEIIESYILNTAPDWIVGDSYAIERNIKDPNSSGYPKSIYEAPASGVSERYGASTIISHTAYNMYAGVNGCEKLTLEELAKLWYNTLLTLPSDCDFVTLRKHAEFASENIGLSESKIKCVKEAFNEAGIHSVYLYSDAPIEIKVYGKDNKLFKDYSATVEVYESLFASKMQYSFSLKSGEGLNLPCDGNLYEIRLDNKLNPEEYFIFTVQTVNGAGDKLPKELPVFSGFTKSENEESLEVGTQNSDSKEAQYEIIRYDRSSVDESGKSRENYYYEYLKLLDNTSGAEKINALLYEKAEKFMTESDGDTIASYGPGNSGYSYAFTRVLYNADGYLNIEIISNSYTGGLHDNTYISNYLFDLATGEIVTLKDLMGLEEEAALKRIREIAYEKAQEAFGDMLEPGAKYSIDYWDMEVYNSLTYLQDGEIWIRLPGNALANYATGSAYAPTGILLGEKTVEENKEPSAGIIDPSLLDSDLDGYTDDVDLDPYVPYKPPIILIHGRISNTSKFFGVNNSIDEETNEVYGVEDESLYTSVASQKITYIDDGKLGEYLVKVLGYEDNKNLFAFNYPNQDMVEINAKIFSQYVNNLLSSFDEGGENYDLRKYIYPTNDHIGQFILIGHSMGGIISRYYIENMNSNHVNKLITICTPHYGSGLGFASDSVDVLFHPCDVDLRKDSMLFGGEKLSHFFFHNKFINYISDEGYATINQSKALKGNKNTEVIYYAISAYNAFDYPEPFDSNEQSGMMAEEMKADLQRGVSFMIDVERNENSLQAFNDSINDRVYEMSMSRYNKGSRLLLKSGDGDTVVNYTSQLGIRFDSEGNFDESQYIRKSKMIITTGYYLPFNTLHTEIAENPLLYVAVKEFIED